jgi:hypothetical protein
MGVLLTTDKTFSDAATGDYLPVTCRNQYATQCANQNPGYRAYFSTSTIPLASATPELGLKSAAICAKMNFLGSAGYLSSSGPYVPNAKVSISYGSDVLNLDTANGITAAGTPDHKAYFSISKASTAFSQGCPENIYTYVDKYGTASLITWDSEVNAKDKYDILVNNLDGKSLENLNAQKNAYNEVISNPTVPVITPSVNGTISISNTGQTVSINRLSVPNINPIIDFVVVADSIGIVANIAQPTITSTNPPLGTCLQTTSTTNTQVSATIYSSSKGKARVDILCNSPLGKKEASQGVEFYTAGESHTVLFSAFVPQNNYTCIFTAYNFGLDGYAKYVESKNAICIQSTQTVYENCPQLYGADTLQIPNVSTGKCYCPYSATTGTAFCGAGMTFSNCKCIQNSPPIIPPIIPCIFEDKSCPIGYTLGKDANGCGKCQVACPLYAPPPSQNCTSYVDSTGCTRYNCGNQSLTCQQKVEADYATCTKNPLDATCGFNKMIGNANCAVDSFFTQLNQLLGNVALLGALCCGGTVLLFIIGGGSFAMFRGMGRGMRGGRRR